MSANLEAYGIAAEQAAPMLAGFAEFEEAERKAADLDTSTSANKHHRDRLHRHLETSWRGFRNTYLRFNPKVSNADREGFGIAVPSGMRRRAGVPSADGMADIERMGTCAYKVVVRDLQNGKRKNPESAHGSNLYTAITPIGQTPAYADFRRTSYAPSNVHAVQFSHGDIGKQAHIFACYANTHGEEGPKGSVATVVVC
ncbi:MAG: hypothetical protein LBS94_01045 [Prevotellaceae bacterium]|nr:hypothetical protein [Prevotellaceae bacterium]